MNVGIIGLGRAAMELHLPVLQRISHADVVFACDVVEENIKHVDRMFPGIRTTSRYEDLIAQDDIDIVAVFTPAFLHEKIGTIALDAGKHVFMEKPLALSSTACDRLIASETRNGGQAMVGFNLRFHRLLREARDIVKSGEIGTIESVNSMVTGSMRQKENMPKWRTQRDQGGSSIFEIGIHQFDLWRWILGEPLKEISAQARIENGIERNVTVSGKTANGVIATGFFSDWTVDHNEIEFLGSKGSVKVSVYRSDGLRRYKTSSFGGGLSARIEELGQALNGWRRSLKTLSLGGDFKATYYFEWLEFLRLIQHGDTDVPRFSDGAYATRVALAATDAVDSKTIVRVGRAPESIPVS